MRSSLTRGARSSAKRIHRPEPLEPRRLFADAVFALGADHYLVAEAAGSVAVAVNRTGDTSAAVDVTYRLFGNTTNPGGAAAGEDYQDVSGTLSFAAGETTKTIAVPILDDQVDEPNETVVLSLTGAAPGGAIGWPGSTLITILDENSPGVLALAQRQYVVSEAAGTLTVVVNRIGSLVGTVGVTYQTAEPILPLAAAAPAWQFEDYPVATAGQDYTHVTGTLTFADGQSSASFEVAILQDALAEGDEPFDIRLYDPTGGATFAWWGAEGAGVTIADDEPANRPPVVGDEVIWTPAGRSLVIDVLANDADPDGDPLTIAPFWPRSPSQSTAASSVAAPVSLLMSEPPAHGVAVVLQNGTPDNPSDDTIRYTPDEGFTGTDTFRYLVSDGRRGGYVWGNVTVIVGGNGGGDIPPTPVVVNGTPGADNVIIVARRAPAIAPLANRVEVFLNGRSRGVSYALGGVFVNCGDGDDRVRVLGRVGVTITADGAAGDDVLFGGAGSDLLVGGDGNDRLVASGGHDLLVGGGGADRLLGGAGDDLLIAGVPPFDPASEELLGALRSFRERWAGATDYPARLAAVTTPDAQQPHRRRGAGVAGDVAGHCHYHRRRRQRHPARAVRHGPRPGRAERAGPVRSGHGGAGQPPLCAAPPRRFAPGVRQPPPGGHVCPAVADHRASAWRQ